MLDIGTLMMLLHRQQQQHGYRASDGCCIGTTTAKTLCTYRIDNDYFSTMRRREHDSQQHTLKRKHQQQEALKHQQQQEALKQQQQQEALKQQKQEEQMSFYRQISTCRSIGQWIESNLLNDAGTHANSSSNVDRQQAMRFHDISKAAGSQAAHFVAIHEPPIGIVDYCERIGRYSFPCMSPNVMVAALHYITSAVPTPNSKLNIHRRLAAAIMIAQKYLEDDPLSITVMSSIFGLSPQELIKLEGIMFCSSHWLNGSAHIAPDCVREWQIRIDSIIDDSSGGTCGNTTDDSDVAMTTLPAADDDPSQQQERLHEECIFVMT